MTIPDEAVFAAAKAITGPLRDPTEWELEQFKRSLTAALPFLQGVKVKALDAWTSATKGKTRYLVLVTVAGDYTVALWGENDFRLSSSYQSGWVRYATLEAAKAAAQADYEARILSAIDVAPSPRAQALEEEAKDQDQAIADLINKYTKATFDYQGKDIPQYVWQLHFSEFAAELRALSSQPVAGDWLPIETAPKDKTIIGFGRMVGVNLCYHNGKQWNKTELSASFQLSSQAITHWRPLPASPGASE